MCEIEAALSDRVIEALDGGKAAVGERFVDEPPKVFGRLELGTVGGPEYETNAVGHGEVLFRMHAAKSEASTPGKRSGCSVHPER